jgi:hypothetical protein
MMGQIFRKLLDPFNQSEPTKILLDEFRRVLLLLQLESISSVLLRKAAHDFCNVYL